MDPLLDVEDSEWAFIADRLTDWLAVNDRSTEPLGWDTVEALRDDIRQALASVEYSGVV